MALHDGLCKITELLTDVISIADDIVKEEISMNFKSDDLTLSEKDFKNLKSSLTKIEHIKEKF